jgi:hypothetical protein
MLNCWLLLRPTGDTPSEQLAVLQVAHPLLLLQLCSSLSSSCTIEALTHLPYGSSSLLLPAGLICTTQQAHNINSSAAQHTDGLQRMLWQCVTCSLFFSHCPRHLFVALQGVEPSLLLLRSSSWTSSLSYAAAAAAAAAAASAC